MIPHRTPFFLPWLYPSLTWRMPAERKELFLTFDDGPVSGPTEFVLDTLNHASISASFFCIGDNIRKHPEVFRKITNSGHTVGNHTFNHLNGWTVSTNKYIENAAEFQKLLEGLRCIRKNNFFRPPYGRITRKQIQGLKDYKIVMWDVLSQDYDHNLSPEKCLRGTIKACRPGSIIVFHDSYKSQKNLEYTLPRLVDHCRHEGYIFSAL
jgi:peptidoglycan/xylan/chitin deacetylase (PgdA/CDA1 family)